MALLKGLETMPLRVRESTASALRLAEWLEEQPAVRWTKYPFLRSTRSTTSRRGRCRPAGRS